MVSKPCIFIASVGRTATHFFGYTMHHMIERCVSFHEADTLDFSKPLDVARKMATYGPLRMTVGKFSPRHSLRVLNLARRRGALSDKEVLENLLFIRSRPIAATKADVYLEANWHYRGLIDLLPLAFPNSRIVYVIRDPRSWVRSQVNKMTLYSGIDVFSRLKNGRLAPRHIGDNLNEDKWKAMSRFEKLCWAWTAENAFALECAFRTDAARVYRYEDLFESHTREGAFTEMLGFVTRFPDGFQAQWHLRQDLLSRKVDSRSAGRFPKWTAWSDEQVDQLEWHCRTLMDRFGYGQETEWRNRVLAAQGGQRRAVSDNPGR